MFGTDTVPRFRVNKLGSRCFTFTLPNSPEKGFMMLVQPIKKVGANCQITVSAFRDAEPDKQFFILERETYSVQFYTRTAKQRHEFVNTLIDMLIEDDFDNPVQVALEVGGVVRHEVVPMPPIPIRFYN